MDKESKHNKVYETIKLGLEDAINSRVTEHSVSCWVDTPMVEYAPVVRCKDCKYLGDNDDYYFCNKIGIAFGDKPNWFCADGERKEKKE